MLTPPETLKKISGVSLAIRSTECSGSAGGCARFFTPKKITISCFNYRTLYVKQPNVASGVQPETKPLKNNGKKRVKCNVVLYYLALLLLNVCTHCNYYFYGFLFYKVFVFVTPPKKHTYTAPPSKTVLQAVSTVTLLKEHRIFNTDVREEKSH